MTAMYWLPRIVLGILVAIYLLTFIDVEIIQSRFFGLVYVCIFLVATFWMAFSSLPELPFVRILLVIAGSFFVISLLGGSDSALFVVVIAYLISLVIEFKTLAKTNPQNPNSASLDKSANAIFGIMLGVAILFGLILLIFSGVTIR